MKILLLTDVPPCKQFSGALLTYHLCKTIPPENIVCAAVRNRDLEYIKTDDDLEIITKYFTKPRENTFWFLNGKIRIFTYFCELYNEFFQVPKLARQIIDFGRQQNVNRIWCVLQGQTMIRLAKWVTQGLKLPLLTQVWDHPIWWMGHNQIDAFTSRRIYKQYEDVLSMSDVCGAASFEMARRIVKNNHIASIPLVSCLPKEWACKPKKFSPKNKKNILLGFCGQTYANEAIDTIIGALDSMGWNINERQVKLRYLGYHISLGGLNKRNVEYLGYRSQQETIELLSESDLLLCPYITDSEYKLVAQTSFPAKLTTYLASGVPILFIGTPDSSPGLFLAENDAGYFPLNISSEKLIECLQQIFSNRSKYESISKNAAIAFHKYLTMEKQAELFNDFLRYGDREL
jgi:glycosyltransferase involved in cell wall biosynthesis